MKKLASFLAVCLLVLVGSQIPTLAQTFTIGSTVEVYNTGGIGLKVRNAPCGDRIGNEPDGSIGVILEGPIYCVLEGTGYYWWRIRWSDGLEGWSAQDWLKIVSSEQLPPSPIRLSAPWAAGLIRYPQTYTGHGGSGTWYAVDFYTDKNKRTGDWYVLAAHSGRAEFKKQNCVKYRERDPNQTYVLVTDESGGIRTYYVHILFPEGVKEGDTRPVQPGDIIGIVRNWGNLDDCQGSPHLHFKVEVREKTGWKYVDIRNIELDGQRLFQSIEKENEIFWGNPITSNNFISPVTDSDNDGIPDSQDRCPYEKGPSSNGGCPLPPAIDSDNDGVPDGQDRCPYQAGPSWNGGCPEPPITYPKIARLSVLAAPSAVTISRGSYQQVIWRFRETNGVGVTITSRTAIFKSPTGQQLSEVIGPYSNNIRVPGNGMADWTDNVYLPPDVADAAKAGGWNSINLEETFYGLDDNNNSVSGTAILIVSISSTSPPPEDDSDNDGIPDDKDNCPYEAGPSWNGGCPTIPPVTDSDNDGIPDSQDRCPYEPGPRENNGCPDPCQMDSDRDGVPDCRDRCPNTPLGAQVDEFGCPVASAPFIKDWLLCGPFPYSPGTEQSAHDNNFIGETTVQPRTGDACGRGVWQTHYGMNDYIDFNNIFMPNEYTVAYAHVYINSPRTQNVQLRLGSDDSIKAWLNGSLVHNNYILRPPAQDQDIVNVTLNAGWNRLLIKVLEVGGDWGFYARFTNTDGSEVQGLTYQLDNPTPSRRDSDGDGIPDGQDRCPYQPGPSWNGGCPEDIEPSPPPLPPVADSDNDGVPDDRDRCPYQAGPGWNDGCPVSSPPPPSSGSKTIEAALDTNGNRILDDDEILRALQYWSSGEEVPGTDGQTIDDAKMLELLHIWASRRPISSASAQSRSIQIGRAESLKVREIKLSPNPVKSIHPATFRAEGSGIAGIKVEVFNLEGMKVFEEEASGNTLRFYAVDNRGRPLANGVYLYVVRVRGFDGREYVSEVRKLVIMR